LIKRVKEACCGGVGAGRPVRMTGWVWDVLMVLRSRQAALQQAHALFSGSPRPPSRDCPQIPTEDCHLTKHPLI